MDLNARPYRAFIAVAETGSFSRAATSLNVSQPALSAQIKEFERRLGFNLFTRSSRAVALTAEGRIFLDRARRLVTETDWANNAARDLRSNQLRIGAAHHTSDIAERNRLIDDFMTFSPETPLRVIRRSPSQLIDDLDDGAIDVAIMLEIDGEELSHHEAATCDRWILGKELLGVLVPASHALAGAGAVESSALRGLEIGTIDRSHGLAVAEGVVRALTRCGAEPFSLPEGDARSIIRQCEALGKCAADLRWFPIGSSTLLPLTIVDWGVATNLIMMAKRKGRRDKTNRFIDRVLSQRTSEQESFASMVEIVR